MLSVCHKTLNKLITFSRELSEFYQEGMLDLHVWVAVFQKLLHLLLFLAQHCQGYTDSMEGITSPGGQCSGHLHMINDRYKLCLSRNIHANRRVTLHELTITVSEQTAHYRYVSENHAAEFSVEGIQLQEAISHTFIYNRSLALTHRLDSWSQALNPKWLEEVCVFL